MDALPPEGENQKLRDQIKQVLEEIKKITMDIFARRTEYGIETYSSEDPCLRLISPLAEGADRLVAEEALKLGIELHCPLPFHREEYAEDFPSESSREIYRNLLSEAKSIFELDGARDASQEAYEMVGRTVLRQCDVLIAIWDQERPSLKGGTGYIVQEAQSLGIPIVWIDPQGRISPVLWEARHSELPGTKRDLSLLRKRLKGMLEFPATAGELAGFSRFSMEKQPLWNHGFFFKVFCMVWAWGWSRPVLKIGNYYKAARAEWVKTWNTLSLTQQSDHSEHKATQPLETGYIEPFAWADGLADFYANKYRTSFVAAYLMGALAILFAYFGSRTSGNIVLYTAIELLLILAIVGLTFWGRRQSWHHRWMSYRALAEQLRQMQFLSLLGRVTSSLYVPTRLKLDDPLNNWFNWYFRAFSRQAGLIQARLDGAYLESYQEVLEDTIQSQLEYHRNNSVNYHKLSRHLRYFTGLLFFATLLCCLLHLFWHDLDLAPSFVFGTIVFPAFGSALGAVLHVGEFERIAIRSDDRKSRLDSLSWQLRSVDETEGSRDLGLIAQNVAEIALADLVDWRSALINKDLVLPA